MKVFYASSEMLGKPTHEGSLAETKYRNGAISRKLLKGDTPNIRYISTSFLVTDAQSQSGTIRVWYARASGTGDAGINLAVFATFLKRGDTPSYTIMQEVVSSHTLVGGPKVDYLEIPFSGAVQGTGQFGIVLDFQNMPGDGTYLMGVELRLN
ncbi:MAG: hypothetical protein ACW99U_10415 [Candidatus Thorarchaeota archaeon]|jgi:hypothetical protein